MSSEVLTNVGEVLDLMALAEARVRDFYRACSRQWTGDREFWQGLAEEEDGHYAVVRRLCGLAEARPAAYSLRAGFNAAAYRSFADMIRDSALAVSGGAMDEQEAVKTARLIEDSILESSVLKSVVTEDGEFLALLSGLAKQTREHSAMVKARFGGVIR